MHFDTEELSNYKTNYYISWYVQRTAANYQPIHLVTDSFNYNAFFAAAKYSFGVNISLETMTITCLICFIQTTVALSASDSGNFYTVIVTYGYSTTCSYNFQNCSISDYMEQQRYKELVEKAENDT